MFSDSTSLEIEKVRLSDAGIYTCESNSKSENSELVLFELSATPSADLIMKETLSINIRSSKSEFTLLWKVPSNIPAVKDLTKNPLILSNVQPDFGGKYTCTVKMTGSKDVDFTKSIEVFGFLPAPDTVYASGSPVTLPWKFNFNVQDQPLGDGVKVIKGAVIHSEEKGKDGTIISNLNLTSATCWPHSCHKKITSGLKSDLSYYLNKPKGGWYHMEITLELKNRRSELSQTICVAAITTSPSPNGKIPLNSPITLSCMVSCMPANGVLCWHKDHENDNTCGQQGDTTIEVELDVLPEYVGNWSCSLLVEKQIMARQVLIIEAALPLQEIMLWSVAGGATVLLLVAVLIATLAVARCRRRRRARYRAWLLQTLHEQRRCECDSKGFIPRRLQETH
ncbi:T-cell surface glycoprotein CD4-like [Pelobates fuscus]|uniref:T-cell surface glycoprotein CD4-like n=1 Tax=Pelobates fuscus TaxID=191477 RepID=UPI002FE4CFA9